MKEKLKQLIEKIVSNTTITPSIDPYEFRDKIIRMVKEKALEELNIDLVDNPDPKLIEFVENQVDNLLHITKVEKVEESSKSAIQSYEDEIDVITKLAANGATKEATVESGRLINKLKEEIKRIKKQKDVDAHDLDILEGIENLLDERLEWHKEHLKNRYKNEFLREPATFKAIVTSLPKGIGIQAQRVANCINQIKEAKNNKERIFKILELGKEIGVLALTPVTFTAKFIIKHWYLLLLIFSILKIPGLFDKKNQPEPEVGDPDLSVDPNLTEGADPNLTNGKTDADLSQYPQPRPTPTPGPINTTQQQTQTQKPPASPQPGPPPVMPTPKPTPTPTPTQPKATPQPSPTPGPTQPPTTAQPSPTPGPTTDASSETIVLESTPDVEITFTPETINPQTIEPTPKPTPTPPPTTAQPSPTPGPTQPPTTAQPSPTPGPTQPPTTAIPTNPGVVVEQNDNCTNLVNGFLQTVGDQGYCVETNTNKIIVHNVEEFIEAAQKNPKSGFAGVVTNSPAEQLRGTYIAMTRYGCTPKTQQIIWVENGADISGVTKHYFENESALADYLATGQDKQLIKYYTDYVKGNGSSTYNQAYNDVLGTSQFQEFCTGFSFDNSLNTILYSLYQMPEEASLLLGF